MSDGISPVQPFIGRTQEMGLLNGLVDHIYERGAALVIHGEAGIREGGTRGIRLLVWARFPCAGHGARDIDMPRGGA